MPHESCSVHAYRHQWEEADLSNLLCLAASWELENSTAVLQTLLHLLPAWSKQSLKAAVSEAVSAESTELLLAASPAPWQDEELASAFLDAIRRGHYAVAESLLKPMQQPPAFEEEQLLPALQRAASPRGKSDGAWWAEQPKIGYNSAAGIRLLLRVFAFRKAALGQVLCTHSMVYGDEARDPSTLQLLLDAAPEPWLAADLLPVLAAAVQSNSLEITQKLVNGVDGVCFTAEQLKVILQEAARRRQCEGIVPVLLSAPSAAWTKQGLLAVLSQAKQGSVARLVLQAAPQPWTITDLLGPFNDAASDGKRPAVVKCLLEVEGVQYPSADLSRALQAAAISGAAGTAEAVEALLKVAPRCSLAVLEAAISKASNKGNLKSLLQQHYWTYEQLWPLVCGAITQKKHNVLDQLLVAGQELPWDLPSLLKALYDVSKAPEATASLIGPLAKTAVACHPNPSSNSSRRSSRCRGKKGSRPPGGGLWEAQHFRLALFLAARDRRPGTVRDLLQLPGLVWDWDDVENAWEAACWRLSKASLKVLLEVPAIWTPARLAECVRSAAGWVQEWREVIEDMLRAKQVEVEGSGSKCGGAGQSKTRQKQR